ncbi:MAG: hypothetical protein JXB47_09625 [Anaerolineae bacterium]|nr:hypothetical protein [Anaerolineae bacterium]
MRRTFLTLFFAVVIATLTACQQPTPPGAGPDIPFDTGPDAVVVKIYDESPASPIYFQSNQLTTCTVYGDGRVVWVGPLEGGGDQLLEGKAGTDALQNYYHFITNLGFFSWNSEVDDAALLPEGVRSYTVIEVTLAGRSHRVAAHNGGALHGFEDIVLRCLELADEPVLIEPRAGWLSAHPTNPDGNRPFTCWPVEAPVKLANISTQESPYWLDGPYAVLIWKTIRETQGIPIFGEGGSCSGIDEVQAAEPLTLYNVIFQVPGFNPSSPPAPVQE